MPVPRSSARAALLVLAALSAAMAWPGEAQAHARLVAAAPAADATVAAPARLQLRFDEQLVAPGSTVELFMTAKPGARLASPLGVAVTAALAADRKTLVVPLRKVLAAGSYLVAWHAATADGERKSGTFRFSVR